MTIYGTYNSVANIFHKDGSAMHDGQFLRHVAHERGLPRHVNGQGFCYQIDDN